MEQLGSHWTDFHEIRYMRIFRKSAEKFPVSLNSNNNNCTLHADRYTFYITSRSVLLTTRNVSDNKKLYRKTKSYFIFSNSFFYENRAVYQIMWKNIGEPGRPQMAIRRMHIAC